MFLFVICMKLKHQLTSQRREHKKKPVNHKQTNTSTMCLFFLLKLEMHRLQRNERKNKRHVCIWIVFFLFKDKEVFHGLGQSKRKLCRHKMINKNKLTAYIHRGKCWIMWSTHLKVKDDKEDTFIYFNYIFNTPPHM